MPALPTGTITFLFSDIEGSTDLLRELGDDYAGALTEHRNVIRAACGAHDGVEVDAQGDAFFFAFARATGAVAAAEAIQRDFADGPISVRIGIHTGEPQLAREGYVGLDVHRGARVCAAGHGGQVLLTQPTRDLVEAETTDLGEHRLKDLLEPQRLYQLGSETFPPLKTLDRTNLPVQATPLVGRERELAEAAALLRKQRLLTFVGPGGTGKTRLALQVAADAAEDFEHVWWVELQEIDDPDLVAPTIAQTVGARGDLAGYLRDRKALLLLDNLEQVRGCAPLLAELVSGSSSLKLLATSREPLRLTVEQQYPVPPLPDDDAIALFHERARAVRPDFAANGAVGEICRRLDRLPLAIELAAARVKLFAPEALLARLEQRLPLLTGGAQDLPERQQTLRATIEWSYDLLEPDEQDLLVRLSVFAGGWTLEAAEAVCECDVDTLAALVDKSLVHEREGRFSMLETIREYALERLGARDPRDEARQLHAAFYIQAAEAPTGELMTPLGPEAVDWFVAEYDNLRAALDWLHTQPDPEPELRLAAACRRFWFQQGYWTEGRRRLELVRARAGQAHPELRARFAIALAQFTWPQGDYEEGKALAEETLSLHRELGINDRLTMHARITLAICEDSLGNRGRATEILEAAESRARAEGDDLSLATILNNLGNMALDERDFPTAKAYIEQSAALHRRQRRWIPAANNLVDLGFIALAEGRGDEAGTALGESAAIARAGRATDTLVWALEGIAALLLERGRAADAALLLAATTRPRADLALAPDFYTLGAENRVRTLEGVRERLSDDGFAAAWAAGERLSLDAAAERAVASVREGGQG